MSRVAGRVDERSKQESVGFVPMRLEPVTPSPDKSYTKITATTTIKGVAADEFEALCASYGLNRSQLVLQMVYHCLNRTKDLEDFYKRLAVLGK